MKGYMIIARNRESGGIVVEVVDDWEEFMEESSRRLIYCQGISDMESAKRALDDLMSSYEFDETGDICQQIADLVTAVQWIANDFPLTSFTRKKLKEEY
jgi:hypothetical protein